MFPSHDRDGVKDTVEYEKLRGQLNQQREELKNKERVANFASVQLQREQEKNLLGASDETIAVFTKAKTDLASWRAEVDATESAIEAYQSEWHKYNDLVEEYWLQLQEFDPAHFGYVL